MKPAAEILREHGIKLSDTAVGRHYVVCPQCSAKRSKAHQGFKVLGITIDDKGVQWGCNHCSWSGGAYFNGKANGAARADGFAGTYDYQDANGVVRFQKVRNAPGRTPKFWMRQPDGRGGWINNTKGVDTSLLYRLPEVIEAIANGYTIAIAEGEKDCNNLWRIGVPATCNAHGAADASKKQKPKWTAAHSEQLRGADVIVLNDNDLSGREHADAAARMSLGVAARVRRLDLAQHWPEMPEKADVSDWIAAGGTREELDALIENAPEFDSIKEPSTTTKADGEDVIALRFAEQHSKTFRYVAASNEWMKWCGARWQTETTYEAFDTARKLGREAGEAKAKTVAAVVTLARTDRRIAATVDQWDSDAAVFNSLSGKVEE